MAPKKAFTMSSTGPGVNSTSGTLHTDDMEPDLNFSKVASAHNFHFKRADLSTVWGKPMLEALDRLQLLVQPTFPSLADLLRKLWADVKAATKEQGEGLRGTINELLDVFLHCEIHKDALVMSNVLPSMEALLSFPDNAIRTKSVKLVNRWRIVMGLRSLDEEVTEAVTQRMADNMTGHPYAPAADVPYHVMLDNLVDIIEQARCMEASYLKRGRQALDMFMTCPITQDMLFKTNIFSQIEKFVSHPDLYIRRRCDEMTASWRMLLTTSSTVEERNIQPTIDDPLEAKRPIFSQPRDHKEPIDSVTGPKVLDSNDSKRSRTEALESAAQNEDTSFSDPTQANEHPIDLLNTTYVFQTFPEFVHAVRVFTKLDEHGMVKIEDDLWALYVAWPGILKKIEMILTKRIEERTHVKTWHSMLTAMRDHFTEPRDDFGAEQIAECEAHLSEQAYMLENFEDPDIWREVHEELHVSMFRTLRTLCLFNGAPHFLSENDKKQTAKINELVTTQKILTLKNREGEELLSILQAKMDSLEELAAKEMNGLEKQKSKYYQDVEKGVNETTSALRNQLNAAKTEAALCRQTLAEKEELKAKNLRHEQEKAQLLATKSQMETELRAAGEATRLITEGYNQLKKTNTELEATVIELQADNEDLLQERNELRSKVAVAQASAQTTPKEPEQTADTATSPTQKHARELQHLNSTIMIWETELAAAQSKKQATREKKNDVDAQIAHVGTQIKALKKPGAQVSEQPPSG